MRPGKPSVCLHQLWQKCACLYSVHAKPSLLHPPPLFPRIQNSHLEVALIALSCSPPTVLHTVLPTTQVFWNSLPDTFHSPHIWNSLLWISSGNLQHLFFSGCSVFPWQQPLPQYEWKRGSLGCLFLPSLLFLHHVKIAKSIYKDKLKADWGKMVEFQLMACLQSRSVSADLVHLPDLTFLLITSDVGHSNMCIEWSGTAVLSNMAYWLTWVLAHLHIARWTLQSSHNAGCNGRGPGAGWVNPGPAGCCKLFVALYHWCSHWKDCRSCLLFLDKKMERALNVLNIEEGNALSSISAFKESPWGKILAWLQSMTKFPSIWRSRNPPTVL